MHILFGCEVLAGSHYLKLHNIALMVPTIKRAKQEGLLPCDSVLYRQKWSRWTALEENVKKICWDFEFTMRKATSARRSSAKIEDDD